jgi:uncharacterized protein YjbI with pentapeptide repeats
MAEDSEIEAEPELKEIPASEILDKIQKGEHIEYDHVIVKGNIDISKLNLPKENENFIISSRIKITNSKIDGDDAIFRKAIFKDTINFNSATFSGYADFNGATFSGYADFNGATFSAYAGFNGATFSAYAGFNGVTFSDAIFSQATFSGLTFFADATFSGVADFNGVTFSGYAYFKGVTFSGYAYFSAAKFEGELLTFQNATFTLPKSQEEACRRAKNVLAKAGNRDEEEYHFYREMEAKRIQKGLRGNSGRGLGYIFFETETWSAQRFFGYDVLEYFFVQKIFGYGIHPIWLFGWWLGFVVVFAAIYSIKGGIEEPTVRQWYDYFWFSVATAATPGYALYKPVGLFKFIAGIEAIIGTFMWAAFITTFARKFSR